MLVVVVAGVAAVCAKAHICASAKNNTPARIFKFDFIRPFMGLFLQLFLTWIEKSPRNLQ
jgi:hypothetical protein